MTEKLKHYSLEGHGGIYDEEAMTALELCARMARKLNEMIDTQNENTETINEMQREQEGLINAAVETFIKSGLFDDAVGNITGNIKDVAKELNTRLDNILLASPELEKRLNARIDAALADHPTLDGNEVLADLCVSDSGATYATPGTAIRTNLQLIKKKIFDPTTNGLGIVGNTENLSWNGEYAANRVGMWKVVKAPETFRATVPEPYQISLTLWDDVDVYGGRANINRIYDSGWCNDVTVPANFPYALTIRTQDDANISRDEIMVVDITLPRYKGENYPNDLANILDGSVHCESWGGNRGYHTNKFTRMATQLFLVNKKLRVTIPDHKPFRFAVHTWNKINGGIPNLFTENDDHNIPDGYFGGDAGWCKSAVILPNSWTVLYFSTEEASTAPMSLDVFNSLVLEWVEEQPVESTSEAGRAFVRGIAHRGLATYAPENTIPAIKEAKRRGFKYVEFDVRFTSDGVPVLLHDETIDRTSNGLGKISSLSYSQVTSFDFGGWFGSAYIGVRIPTLDEALSLCKKVGLIPYIELKDLPENKETEIVNIIKSNGFLHNCVVCSFDKSYLQRIHSGGFDHSLGVITNAIDENTCDLGFMSSEEPIVIASDPKRSSAYIPDGWLFHIFTLDDVTSILNSDYADGIISNNLDASRVLYENAML